LLIGLFSRYAIGLSARLKDPPRQGQFLTMRPSTSLNSIYRPCGSFNMIDGLISDDNFLSTDKVSNFILLYFLD
jgi:hypothetical protein